jgi:hypothetical protein
VPEHQDFAADARTARRQAADVVELSSDDDDDDDDDFAR